MKCSIVLLFLQLRISKAKENLECGRFYETNKWFIFKFLSLFESITADFPSEVYNIETSNNGTSSRIYDGTKANGHLPYQAFVVVWEITVFMSCGGTLLSPNHILTARHCVVDNTNYFKFSSDNVFVRIGFHKVTKDDIISKNDVSFRLLLELSVSN